MRAVIAPIIGNKQFCLLCLFLFFCSFSNELLSAELINDPADRKHMQMFFNWLKENYDRKTGLPYSHVGDNRFYRWTITYDSAVVTLAYIASGKLNRACRIINYYIDTPEVWCLNGVIEAFIASPYISGQDYSVRSGANAWLAIAAARLYVHTNNQRYLEFAERIAALLLSLQNQDEGEANFGGVVLGPSGDPAFSGDQHIAYNKNLPAFNEIYSTEINIDAYVLFFLLHKATNNRKYSAAANGCRRWLKTNGLNHREKRFNRGYQDAVIATDVQSWAISALGVDLLDSFQAGLAEEVIRFVERNCLNRVEYELKGKRYSVEGVDFIDRNRAKQLGREPLVSFEWSFQLANAYRRLERDFRKNGDNKKAELYKDKRKSLIAALLQGSVEQEKGWAYPYATQANAVIGHEYYTPNEGNLSAIGAAYAILALKGYDPLVVDDFGS